MGSIALYLLYEENEKKSLRIQRRLVRNSSSPLQLMDEEFKRHFRLNKPAFKYILDVFRNELGPVTRATSIPLECKLAGVLRFFADGGYQRGVGNDFNVGVSQSSFSMTLSEVLNILESKLCPQWINLKMRESEKMEAKLYFFEKSKIPGVVMCVDGTHVRILPPTRDAHLFYNRKGFYSLNTMIICDHKQRIKFVDAKYPGASHDSFVWNARESAKFFQNNYENGDCNTRILGDAGYPLQPWLITPFRASTPESPESKFNKYHSKGRIRIEHTIGVLKNRFRCLLGARQLHYSPQKVVQIINVCCALHNICIYYEVGDELLEEEQTENGNETGQVHPPQVYNAYTNIANEIRNTILRNFQ